MNQEEFTAKEKELKERIKNLLDEVVSTELELKNLKGGYFCDRDAAQRGWVISGTGVDVFIPDKVVQSGIITINH